MRNFTWRSTQSDTWNKEVLAKFWKNVQL